MRQSFVIDALPESAARYRSTHSMVVVDVFRATTVIVTALAGGHSVYPVATVAEAVEVASRLHEPLLVGEQAGDKPAAFHHDNSPAALNSTLGSNPVVLLTSAGTLLLTSCRGAPAIYVACLRNLLTTAREVSRHRRVALIGAGTRGQSRPEDQLVCARIGDFLLGEGFVSEDERTLDEIEHWRGADLEVLRRSPSARFLRETGQQRDIEFVLSHVEDVEAVAVYNGQQVSLLSAAVGDRLAADAT